MVARFSDPERGGFFLHVQTITNGSSRARKTPTTAPPRPATEWPPGPCSNSADIAGRTDLEEQAYRTLESLSGVMSEQPRAAGQALLALDFHLGPAPEIVLIDGADAAETDDVLRRLNSRFLPNKVVVRPSPNSAAAVPDVLQSLLTDRTAVDGRVTAYVCDHGACGLPIAGTDAIVAELDRHQKSRGV